MRLMRNSKWEWAVYAGVSTAFMMGLVYTAWTTIRGDVPNMDWWSGWAVAIWLADVFIAYILGRRIHRRLDQLQLAMKEAATSNWSVRLPELSKDAFGETYREFNFMVDKLDSRMKLLQQLGEKRVLEEAPALEVAVQEERKRLARDLHDTVSQQLFALHMAASALPKLVERNPEQGDKVMEQLIQMSSSAQKQMRGLIAQLRPMELQGRSLTEALDRWFPDFCRQNGLQGTLDVQVAGPISEAKEHQLFLITQEAMANVVKHANAKEVRLALGQTESQIILQIEDNGDGFAAERVRAGSYGLTSMRERAEKLGGEAEIVTKPGTGTRVLVRFPNF